MDGLKFYRCSLCGSVVSRWDIESGKCCPKCGGHRINPSNLNIWEMFIQIKRHPKVWKWNGEGDDE